jgi:hypothetical protein
MSRKVLLQITKFKVEHVFDALAFKPKLTKENGRQIKAKAAYASINKEYTRLRLLLQRNTSSTAASQNEKSTATAGVRSCDFGRQTHRSMPLDRQVRTIQSLPHRVQRTKQQ